MVVLCKIAITKSEYVLQVVEAMESAGGKNFQILAFRVESPGYAEGWRFNSDLLQHFVIGFFGVSQQHLWNFATDKSSSGEDWVRGIAPTSCFPRPNGNFVKGHCWTGCKYIDVELKDRNNKIINPCQKSVFLMR